MSSATRSPGLEALGLAKDHGGEFRLEIDRIEIPAGRLFCLLGPTGAGKSTLLRLLAGVEAADTGEVRMGGVRLGLAAPLDLRRRVVLVFQKPQLLAGSVAYNVGYGLKLRGMSDRDRRVLPMLERLGLAGLADRKVDTLSGGQAQMVALARALVLEPEVLLLDEPTSHLDPARVARVEEVVTEEQMRRSTTVVWATHNFFQARRIAQDAAVVLGGHIIEMGSADALFRSPRDPRTRDFLEGRLVYE